MVDFARNCIVKMTLRQGSLATSCCYDHGANVSEAVQKIATDQRE